MDDWTVDLMLGDCLEMLKELDDNSVDAVVCDPPYGLSKEPDMAEVLRHWLAGDDYEHRGKGFMGKSWDSFVPGPSVWRECYRVLKPGGHMLSFFGTRTYDMGVLAIRLAGFEIRDQVGWCYGSGFPKSLDVSKAIDKAAGAKRKVVGIREDFARRANTKPSNREKMGQFADDKHKMGEVTAPATPEAEQWQGWGTALKPAWEPICVARKPLEGTVAANVLEWGTGAINVDGARVPGVKPQVTQGINSNATSFAVAKERRISGDPNEGRWPANICHDGSDEVVDLLGSAARFFYCAKASKRDRDEGLEAFAAVHRPNGNKWTDQDYRVARGERPPSAESGPRKNHHPTVKPTDLMRYLCRLVTPPSGVVLDPFMGSGSTGKAAMLEGFRFIGIERDEAYFDIAEARIMAAKEAAKCKE